MRFVWAVIAFVLAAALIGAGIAQRTVFLGPDTAEMAIETTEEQPYTLIDAEVLRAHQGTQTLDVSGSDRVYLAYGRTADMEAWLSDAPFTHVTLDDSGQAVSESVDAAEPTWEGPEFPGRDPRGADLWLEEYEGEGSLSTRLQLPEGVSVLLASDGRAPAPADISIVWPISNATPWAGPLIVGGAILLLLGIILWILGLRHVRRSRGPRRKGSVLPPTQPLALGSGRRRGAVAAAEPRKEITSGPDSDAPEADDTKNTDETPDAAGADEQDAAKPGEGGGRRRGGRALIALPAIGLTAALLTGCSPEAWPQLTASPTPTPTPTVVAPENQQAPALTDAQAQRIVASLAETVAEADENRDGELAATRLDGVALEMREVNYRIRQDVEDHPAPLPIPGASVQVLLPQAFDEWPRSAMLIVEGEDSGDQPAPPSIMNLTQADPWSDYKLTTVASLEAAVEIPDLAPSWLGAALVPPDSSFLAVAPNDLAATYADVLANGEKSQYASLFDMENDSFRVAAEERRAATLAHFNETGQETGEIEFGSGPGPGDPTALATLESGAIVAVTVDEVEKVRPTADDAAIKLDGDPALSTLTGETASATGVATTYTDQLFFAVPAQGSTEKIRLLGYSSGLRNAEILGEGE
ncbi:glycosyl transferase [Microbacterium rhizophilus]|uniref:glycosyl transferase n=1 Tax=Microbacterium rhizophilus TaxID=3138934 RepID=UPI0031F085D2